MAPNKQKALCSIFYFYKDKISFLGFFFATVFGWLLVLFFERIFLIWQLQNAKQRRSKVMQSIGKRFKRAWFIL